jgi:signal transduction histidine kinase
LVLFVAIIFIPTCALAWLAWRMLELDRVAAQQAARDRLDTSAGLLAGRMLARLSEIEDQLPRLRVDDDAVVVRLRRDAVEVRSGPALLYHPMVPAPPDSPATTYEAAEQAEFQRKDYPAAIRLLQEIAVSPDPTTQTGALLRLARNYRKNGQPGEAIRAYERLASLGLEPVSRHGICSVLEQFDPSKLPACAAAFHEGLRDGRWRLDKPSFEFHEAQARRWLDGRASTMEGRRALANAVQSLWRTWRPGEDSRGRKIDGMVLVLWKASAGECDALAAGPRWLSRTFAGAPGLQVSFVDGNNNRFAGDEPAPGARRVLLNPIQTRLPWGLQVAAVGPDPEAGEFVLRRRLVLAGAGVIAVLLIAGSYFITRAVSRGLAVARLQSDFVSAVSHEFRTPLTTLRHMTELLHRGTVAEDRRPRYYQVLARETERLHRLVEGLLDFGRMEAGRKPYHFLPLDASALVRDLVSEFRQEITGHKHRIELSEDALDVIIRADREALGRALWNLLDNAVKYSPGSDAVWVETGREEGRLAIRVRDSGAGIPPGEQFEIFRKFVRGQSARETGAKGTGLGLAIVDHIVRAHGGEIRLQSEPNHGSTFTLLLPLENCA